jgi:methylation protein EvaC
MDNQRCRVSNSFLQKFLDFGIQPLGNGFLDKKDFGSEFFYNMSMGFSEESFMVQLIDQPKPEQMFHDKYAFFSSTSKYMHKHFENFALDVLNSGFISNKSPFIVELGCNDGILLKNFANKKIKHLGIEPSKNVAREANKNGVQTVSDFFTENLAKEIVDQYGKADAFLAANVMCHIPDILGVAKGIKAILKSKGVVMFEEPYLGDIISKNSYDQIYDEHVFLFSLHSIKFLFNLVDMELIDAIPQTTHGGSMRYVLAHKGAHQINPSVDHLLAQEKKQKLDRFSTFINFGLEVEKSKRELIKLLQEIKSKGKTIAGYAATSKSTTVLNYCNIGVDLISYISDTTPIKQGKFSPGMHIPIVPYENFVSNPPDYAFLFAWNHMDEIMSKEKNFRTNGGNWITHVPKVRIL